MRYIFDVTLQNKKIIAEDTYEIILSIQEADFHFIPGQYIWLVLPKMDFDDPKGNRRAFSISSSSSETKQISVIFRNSLSGFKKSLLALSHNSKLQIIGPFGSAFSTENMSQPDMCIIAGGTGIVPFLSILRSPLFLKDTQSVKIVTINSSQKREIYMEEIAKICQEKNITFNSTIGNLTWEKRVLPEKQLETTAFFIAGPQRMVDGVTSSLISHGIKFDKLFFESNYPIFYNTLRRDEVDKFTSEKNHIGLMALEQSTQHIVITDENGVVLYVNKAATKTTGFTKEEILGSTPRLWGGLNTAEFYKKLWKGLKEGKPFTGHLTNRRKNGQLYNVVAHISPFVNDKREVIGFVATEEDVTQLVSLEEQLKVQNTRIIEEKRKSDAILESIGDGVVALDRDSKIILVNNTLEKMLGLRSDELLNTYFFDSIKALDDNDHYVKPENFGFKKSLISLNPVTVILTFVRKNGSRFVAQVIHTPIMSSGTILGVVTVIRDITKEREIDRIKDQFLSVASHELRTPLTAIDGLVSMILDGEYGPVSDNLKQPLKDVSESSERLIHLVNDLLSVSRMQAGRLKYTLTEFYLAKKLAETITLLEVLAEKKNITLKITECVDVCVQADEEKFTQILTNIIGNALKFTDTGGITVSAQKTTDHVEISIVDTGIGIAKEDQSKLFKKFEQVNPTEDRPAGTGLGLYISMEMARKMGGDVWLSESTPGTGSTFIFSVPIAKSKIAEKAEERIKNEAKAKLDQKSDAIKMT